MTDNENQSILYSCAEMGRPTNSFFGLEVTVARLYGFVLDFPWDSKNTQRTVNYSFGKRQTWLDVTVEDTGSDTFSDVALLKFLMRKGVINKIKDWKVTEKYDTEGSSIFDDVDFTTVVFKRVVPL